MKTREYIKTTNPCRAGIRELMKFDELRDSINHQTIRVDWLLLTISFDLDLTKHDEINRHIRDISDWCINGMKINTSGQTISSLYNFDLLNYNSYKIGSIDRMISLMLSYKNKIIKFNGLSDVEFIKECNYGYNWHFPDIIDQNIIEEFYILVVVSYICSYISSIHNNCGIDKTLPEISNRIRDKLSTYRYETI